MKKRMPAYYLRLAIAPLALLTACSTDSVLQSTKLENLDNSFLRAPISDYRLARSLLPISLKRSGENFAIEVAEPIAVGDPNELYFLHYNPSSFAEDDFSIEVDSSTRLLKTIHLKSTEKSDDILIKAVESIPRLESGPAAQQDEEILISMDVDPSNASQVEKLRSSLLKASGESVVSFHILPLSTIENTGSAGINPDCSVGFCYRSPAVYQISFSFKNGRYFEKEISLPNGGPIISVPLTRAAFVEKITNIDFTSGTPHSIAIKKPSEALELAALPLSIAKAILRVPAEILKLKIDISDEEKNLAEAERTKLESEKALEKAKVDAALESGALMRRRNLIMFGASGGWKGGGIPTSQTPEGVRTLEPAQSHGSLEEIGGAKGED